MVKVSPELLRQVDILVKRHLYESREEFVDAAIRRVIDYHSLALPPLKTLTLPPLKRLASAR
jgi:metal-responsive CopG/Arc/MetJ family transcriptional regulator